METSALKCARKARGLSQEEVAARLGTGQSSVSKWERGIVPPGHVLDLSEMLGIPPHLLRPDLYRAPDLPDREVNADVR